MNFETKLTEMFSVVEPAFRKATLLRYREAADRQLAGWLRLLEGDEPPRNMYYNIVTSQPQYVRRLKSSDSYEHPNAWELKQTIAKTGGYRADYEKAKKDANALVDQAKQHFISKQTKKLTTATKLRTDTPKLGGTLSFNGVVVTGHLLVTYGDSLFRLDMSMIYNHRYERGYTEFYQFPARFKTVVIAGERATGRISEKWMSENFR